ncbi:hypothetical protein CONLIGDRAFT_635630 [Coniochaeta ligniaria NRRL 30616]|uniref:Ribosomal protein/NADH dehydrogenase domain-containing protein n=1 Tax=Coniochaeta ligniaria NRRL 30616 TaxID=1408157 RepID=A0A1J7IXR8_9PEZI|nr:hypothetical protein CONLIGDRAFT_635630 [Coniochaeta ligniaria NRRL 30616]
MPGVIRRLHKLKALLNVRHGPGAAILPPQVTRIHLEYAGPSNELGHMGSKKFFKENLPRLKYWNPATPMIVNRHNDNTVPPTMTIYLRDEDRHARYDDTTAGPDQVTTSTISSAWDGSAKAPLPAEDERIVTIEMRNQHSSVILKELMEKTRAVPVSPTPQEQTELDEIEELRQRGEVDREKLRKQREAEKREAALMSQARSEAAAFKASTI